MKYLLPQELIIAPWVLTLKVPIKITCIDASDKPDVIPDKEWIVEGKEYKIFKIQHLGNEKFSIFIEGIDHSKYGFTGIKLERFERTKHVNSSMTKEIKQLFNPGNPNYRGYKGRKFHNESY